MRLRFDRVAQGFVERVKAGASPLVPAGSVLVFMLTAPIRQDSKTSTTLIGKIAQMLAARRTRMKFAVNDKQIQVRVLSGFTGRHPMVVGFAHTRGPDPSASIESV